LVVTIPPNIDEICLEIFNPNIAASPSLQTYFPLNLAPKE